MEQKIRLISEAFSMQPINFEVQEKLGKFDRPEFTVKIIKKEEVITDYHNGEPNTRTCYIGYNHNGEKMFQYLANTVNVHYDMSIKPEQL